MAIKCGQIHSNDCTNFIIIFRKLQIVTINQAGVFVQLTGVNVIKPFLSVIYSFSK